MSDFQINDHLLTKECDAIAKEIFDNVLAENPDSEPEDLREDMFDRAHETADGHEWVIYNYKALVLCAHCDTSDGEDFIDDIGFEWKQGESTIYTVATAVAYGEMRARIEQELQCLIDEWEAPQVAP